MSELWRDDAYADASSYVEMTATPRYADEMRCFMRELCALPPRRNAVTLAMRRHAAVG